jgi:hypothetical protein
MNTNRNKQLPAQSNEVTFDMRFHAFVLAVPRKGNGLGEPAIVMNGGDKSSLSAALRIIADEIEAGSTHEFPLQ